MLLAQAQSIPTQTPLLIAMAVLLVFSALASASETALFGLSRAKLAALRVEHPRIALSVDRLLSNPRQLLLQVLLLNMVANLGYFIATSILTLNAHSATARITISVVSLLCIIVVGEVFAKLMAVSVPNFCLRVVTPIQLVIRQPLRPLIVVLERYFILPGTRLLVPGAPPPPGITAEEMATLLTMGTNEGLIDQSEQDLLASIVTLSSRKVEEIMRPRVDFQWVDADATREEVLEVCRATRTTRFPVFEDGIDGTPIGMTDAKRVLAGAKVRDTLSPLLFIPEQATLGTLLDQLRNNAQTIALVVDEHGTVVGLVTLTDIARQLLSGTSDSQTPEAQDIILVGPSTWEVPGRIAVHEWSTLFGGIGPASSPARTLAGLIMHTLGRVPKVGDEINLGAAILRVIAMNDLVVKTVEVQLRPKAKKKKSSSKRASAKPDPSKPDRSKPDAPQQGGKQR